MPSFCSAVASELVPHSNSDLPRRLVGEDAAEVRVRRVEGDLRPVIEMELTLPIEASRHVYVKEEATLISMKSGRHPAIHL